MAELNTCHMTSKCNNCIHKPVCSKYIAMGDVTSCDHYKEERKGEWLGRRLDNFRKYEVQCPFCGWIGIENYDSYNDPTSFLFCPYCGADMRGEEDG